MSIIRIEDSFPPGADGQRKPLPKQQEFLNKTLSIGTPKYIAYVGGIGSGKSLIGCITMLTQAILHPGTYLIARQFMPELKITTYRTFLEICPPELIIENRIADMQITIEAQGGKSTILFRQLEESDKLRSLNLSGFLIDEANQVSEEAFVLLQGRLRGAGLCKGLIVSNPAGHDWLYKWFKKQDFFKKESTKKEYYLIQAPSTENIHLREDYISSLLETWSEDRIKREIYGSFDAFEGMVYHEFRRDIHAIRPFRIPDTWDRHIRIDHGYRNPAAVLFCAVSPDGEVYVYRELYVKEYLIHEIIKGDRKSGKTGILDYVKGEKSFKSVKIDPSTKARRGTTGESDYDEYKRHWPENMPPIQMAKNDVQLGVERVKSYLKLNPRLNKPMLFIFDTCINLLEEISTYRYPNLAPTDTGKKAEKENPLKVDDHALDALRYMIIDLPEPYRQEIDEQERRKKYTNVELQFQDELKIAKKPKNDKIDPWGDIG